MRLYVDRKTRRDRLQIYADILIGAGDLIRPTRLMYRSVVQYRYFKPMIQKLIELGFLEEEDNKLITTEEGKKFIRKIDGIYKLLGEY